MKRIISLLLTLMIAFTAAALTACGDKEGGDAQPVASVADDLTPNGYNAEGNPTGFSKSEYDENDRLIRNYTYDSLGNLQGSIGHEYDENGEISKDIMYDSDGKITSQVAYEKNADGFITKRTNMDAQGTVTAVTDTEYDDAGNQISVYKYDGSNTLLRYQIFEYEDGDLVKLTLYNADDTVDSYITYETTDDGAIIENKYDGDGKLISNK